MIPGSRILAEVWGDPEIARIFSDEAFVSQMVRVEIALARVQERLGIIPEGVFDTIASAIDSLEIDLVPIQRSMEQSGIPTIGMVDQLRAAVGGAAASYVHWGATTQDIMDTALVLQIREALAHMDDVLNRIIASLAAMADRHRTTIMAGRTKSQQALPITFGLKVATWLAPLLRHRVRLEEMKPRLLVVQFGGAVGTLASLEDRGIETMEALAAELQLEAPAAPWHTQRDNIVELANWLSMVSGSLAKMAQDVILLAQTELVEVRESNDPSRGGSSTMPQKSNPVVSEAIIAAARANANLVATMHQAMIQEHERGTGSWQIEWLTLPHMFELTASVLNNALFLSENLVVDADRMQSNLDASNGLMLAETLNLALAPHLGRAEAKTLVQSAIQTTITEDRHLVDIIGEQVDVELDWDSIRDEANYLGSTDAIIDRVLLLTQR